MQSVFITGGTGYMGKRLVSSLLKENNAVKVLVRKGSENKLPAACDFVVANAFDENSFMHAIPQNSIFVQLLGVPHPGPSKRKLFKTIDLASAKASARAAQYAKAIHFIYVSVAQTPSKIMQDFQQCRAEAEFVIQSTGIPATFIRPWYVIGPGHYWPLLLLPFFKLLEIIPSTSAKAKALRFVSLKQMLSVLMFAVKNPPEKKLRIVEVEEIRKY